MKDKIQGLVAGVLIGAILAGTAAIAANTTTLYDVIASGIKIVVDGKEIISVDASGNKVEPIIYSGTTYLPVRAVADALGKAVYWDGPNYTVYLGNMDGKLEYPTATITDVDNIGSHFNTASTRELTDNYGNTYSYAITDGTIDIDTFKTLLNSKYSRFKGTLYIPKGTSRNASCNILIKADGKIIYSSPEITKESKPISLDLNITGCNIFEIVFNYDSISYSSPVYLGDAGFYQ